MTETVLIVMAYLIGSISFAVVVSKLLALPDPHSYGSGNPGATNVLRTGNKPAAMLTLLGDAAKGWVAVWLTRNLAGPHEQITILVALAALAVFFGHLYPVFHRFRGGKGVATALGVLFALNWKLGFIVLIIWFMVFYFSRISSLAAIVAALLSPILALRFFDFTALTASVFVMASMLIWRHRTNIRKLRAGTEARIGGGKA